MDTLGFKIGDIVFTYNKGVFRITDFFEYEYSLNGVDHKAVQVRATKLATNNLKPCKPTLVSCSVEYCSAVPENTIEYAKSNGVKFE
jgi:hypothetical protein